MHETEDRTAADQAARQRPGTPNRLIDVLAGYAAYHRDRRNIATHIVGIPMIVLGVAILLARPQWDIAGLPLSPAIGAALLLVSWYATMDLRFAAAMALVYAATLAVALPLATGTTTTWLAAGLGFFVVGWIIQFVGHAFEGRKPAFFDDVRGLGIGPLFVAAEIGFALGWRTDVRDAIEARFERPDTVEGGREAPASRTAARTRP